MEKDANAYLLSMVKRCVYGGGNLLLAVEKVQEFGLIISFAAKYHQR